MGIGKHTCMKKTPVYQVSDQKFIKAVTSANNIRQALIMMGLNTKGQAYSVFKRRCNQLGLDIPVSLQKKKRLSITARQIKFACKKANSRRQALINLNLKEVHSNIRWIDNKIEELKLNINHWTGQGHLKGKTHNWSIKIPLKDILVKNSKYTSSHSLKNRLIKEGLLLYECYVCKIKTWQNKKLSLQLDHINGNCTDHRLKNLRLLCPNCHSQTKTFAGKNKKS